MRRLLADIQQDFVYDTLRLSSDKLAELATLLVEFGEDLHANIGMWPALEQYNREFFDTPLPVTLAPGATDGESPQLVDRLHHFLWVLHTEIEPDLVLAPQHQDLRYQADTVAQFLGERLLKIPPDSGIRHFLEQPNRFGWDIKRKLVWMGQHAYLFRLPFRKYVEVNGKENDIGTIDDFICQETTRWSGLGVIDILAGVLPLSAAQRATLQNWYERHFAFYQVKAAKRGDLRLVNLVNNQPYKVRIDKRNQQFRPGDVVFGGLLPWNEVWYWSGTQQLYGSISAEVRKTLPAEMLGRTAQIVYRYYPEKLQQAQESVTRWQRTFLNYHGDDLVIYPDGIAMAGDMQKMYRLQNETIPEADRAELLATHNLTSAQPKMPLPPELVKTEDGVAVFFNPGEGTEIFNHFDVLASALQKEGRNLTEDESWAVQGLIESDTLSPAFVRRLLQNYSDASIYTTYLIGDPQPHHLDYLLRRYKGHFYRRRYPQVTLVD